MTQASCDLACVYVFRHREHGPEFLLLRRAADSYMGGTWQPIYGGIEVGETASQAALREMREETGLMPDRLFQANSVDTFYVADNDTVYSCPVFAAEVPGDAQVELNPEHDAFDWVHADEIAGQLMWPGQRRMVGEIVEEIIRGGPGKPFLQIRL